MRKNIIKLAALGMALILIVPPVLDKNYKLVSAVTSEDINNAKAEKEAIEKRKQEAQANLDKLVTERNNIQNYVLELDKQLATINENIYDLTNKMEAKQVQIDATKIELDDAQKDVDDQYASMKLRIQYMYETGQTTYLEAFLASESIADLLNRTEYVTSITEYDKKMMDKLVISLQVVKDTKERLEKEFAELEDLRIKNEAELAAAEVLHAAKVKELEVAQAKAEEAKKLTEQLEKEKKEADNKIDKLIAQQAAEEEARRQQQIQAGLASGNGNSKLDSKSFLGWPLPSNFTIVTERFGPRIAPVTGASSYHYAIDLNAHMGTPVYAAAAGTIMIAEYNYSYGNYILVYHGDGIYTLYAHASSLLVTPGQQVKKGQTIMLAGSTGYSTGPHLHFEVRINGNRVNPLDYYNTEGLSYYGC